MPPGANRLRPRKAAPRPRVHYTNDTYAIAHSLGRALIAGGNDSWFFVTVDYSYGYDLENETTAVVKANGGTVLRPCPTSARCARFLVLSAAGAAIPRQGDRARQWRSRHQQRDQARRRARYDPVTAAVRRDYWLRINQINDLGLNTRSQGMMLAESFYWDSNDAARAWSKRFFDNVGQMPNLGPQGRCLLVDDPLPAGRRQSKHRCQRDPGGCRRCAPRRSTISLSHDGHICADGTDGARDAAVSGSRPRRGRNMPGTPRSR